MVAEAVGRGDADAEVVDRAAGAEGRAEGVAADEVEADGAEVVEGCEARYSLVKSMRDCSSSLRFKYSAFCGSLAKASLICES